LKGTSFLILVLAGCGERILLPSKFVEMMEGQELVHAIVQEGSTGQPSYEVEVFYDGKGKCYFRVGWSSFFADYSVEKGWFLLFSRCCETHKFYIRVIDGSLCCRSFAA
jgi:hypothetical protein